MKKSVIFTAVFSFCMILFLASPQVLAHNEDLIEKQLQQNQQLLKQHNKLIQQNQQLVADFSKLESEIQKLKKRLSSREEHIVLDAENKKLSVNGAIKANKVFIGKSMVSSRLLNVYGAIDIARFRGTQGWVDIDGGGQQITANKALRLRVGRLHSVQIREDRMVIGCNNQPVYIGHDDKGSNFFIQRGTITDFKSGDGWAKLMAHILSPSSQKWKENITTITNSISKIENLRGVSFSWKNGKADMGVIAEEVHKVLPELTDFDGKNVTSVNYHGLTAVLIEAVKEQRKISNQQKQKVQSLEMKVHKQQHEIQQLQQKVQMMYSLRDEIENLKKMVQK